MQAATKLGGKDTLARNGNTAVKEAGNGTKAPAHETVYQTLRQQILFGELASGVLCAIGIYEFLYSGQSSMAFCGAVLCSITLLMLLLGQRIAKDYEGAKTIVVYLILAIFLVYILQ